MFNSQDALNLKTSQQRRFPFCFLKHCWKAALSTGGLKAARFGWWWIRKIRCLVFVIVICSKYLYDLSYRDLITAIHLAGKDSTGKLFWSRDEPLVCLSWICSCLRVTIKLCRMSSTHSRWFYWECPSRTCICRYLKQNL